jgi:phosphatidylglycerol:prolipoprotein diacylglycerol transferase
MPPTTARNLSAWGVDVPPGVEPSTVLAVHPTQVYETTLMLLAFWLLWRWRTHSRGTGWLFGVYLILAGAERFLIEFIRAKDDRFFGNFTLAQGAALVAVVLGVTLVAQLRSRNQVPVDRVEALQPRTDQA